jgi:hypothetical protein
MKTLFTGLLSAACFSLLALHPAAAQTAKPKAKPASPKTPVAKTAAALAAPKEKPPVGSAPRDFKLPPRQDFTLAGWCRLAKCRR